MWSLAFCDFGKNTLILEDPAVLPAEETALSSHEWWLC